MQVNQKAKRRKAGFSLAELMVVILIIGLLATLVVPKVMDSFGDAKWGKVKADLGGIKSGLDAFARNNGGNYPDSLEQLVERDANGKRYLEQTIVPKDPWDREYDYTPPQGNQDLVVVCYGKDGSPGGEGDDRDMTLQDVINGVN